VPGALICKKTVGVKVLRARISFAESSRPTGQQGHLMVHSWFLLSMLPRISDLSTWQGELQLVAAGRAINMDIHVDYQERQCLRYLTFRRLLSLESAKQRTWKFSAGDIHCSRVNERHNGCSQLLTLRRHPEHGMVGNRNIDDMICNLWQALERGSASLLARIMCLVDEMEMQAGGDGLLWRGAIRLSTQVSYGA
jgi:hypothetical protein